MFIRASLSAFFKTVIMIKDDNLVWDSLPSYLTLAYARLISVRFIFLFATFKIIREKKIHPARSPAVHQLHLVSSVLHLNITLSNA